MNEEESAEQTKVNEDGEEEEDSQETVSEGRQRTQYGEWINKSTGAGIGGEDGTLEFNVME